MTVPNSHPRIFVPGKIVQVRSAEDPLLLSKLVLISVEEHVRHVVEMLEWLFPDATETQRAGAALHDVHKKVGARHDFFDACGCKPAPAKEDLRADFYGEDRNCVGIGLSAGDASQGFLEFVKDDPDRRRLWPIRDGLGALTEVRVDINSPFGNHHAAEATEDDLAPYRDGSLILAEDSVRCDYVLNLVRLHHSFDPNRIIDACAQHGDGIARDLYRLIVADHAGSRWAEYVVQQLEEGLEKPEAVDFFGEVELKVAAEPVAGNGDRDLKFGRIRLQRSQLPNEAGNPREAELLVRYYPVTVNWDLRMLVETAAAKSPTERKERASGARGRQRARS
jgi:hypothetical protein